MDTKLGRVVVGMVLVVLAAGGCRSQPESRPQPVVPREVVEEVVSETEARRLATAFLEARAGLQYKAKEVRPHAGGWILFFRCEEGDGQAKPRLFEVRLSDDGAIGHIRDGSGADVGWADGGIGPVESERAAEERALRAVRRAEPRLACKPKNTIRLRPGWTVRLGPGEDVSFTAEDVIIIVDDDGYVVPPPGLFDPGKDRVDVSLRD